jgi:hypothetical protein
MKAKVILAICILSLAVGVSHMRAQESAPSEPTTQPIPKDWKQLIKESGLKGELKDDVYTVRLTRDDLDVQFDGGLVPFGAGLESVFYFFPCPCGTMNATGQFCLVEWEVNDVIDALRKADIKITSLAPMMIGERPRMMLLRYQAEGQPEPIITAIKNSLEWVGPARMAAPKVVLPPPKAPLDH